MSVVVGASMVTVGTSRRSRRAVTSGARADRWAASSTAAGKADRMPWRTTQRSRPRSAPTGTVREGTTWVPRIAPTTNAPSSRASADPSSKGQSVLATTRSTRRKRRRPCAVTVPKSSVRCRSTRASAVALVRPEGSGGDGGRDQVAVEEGVEVRRGDERGGVAVGALEVEEAEASGMDGDAAGEAGGDGLHDRRHPTSVQDHRMERRHPAGGPPARRRRSMRLAARHLDSSVAGA